MTATPKTISIGTFAPGMDNRRPDFTLRTDKGYLQRDAVNIDVTASGSAKRRRGYTSALPGLASHSIWSDDSAAFYVEGETLFALAGLDGVLSATAVTTGLLAGHALSYWTAPEGGTYWTDGRRLERAVGGVSVPLAPPTPASLPIIFVSAGLLASGEYLMLFTALDSEGRESAASHPVPLSLGENSGLALTAAALPSGTAKINVYLTGPGGEIYYRAAQISGAGTTYVTAQATGPRCTTIGLQPMPAGQIVRSFGGYLLVASGAVLFRSEPFMPGLYNPTSGFIPLPDTITILEPMTGETPSGNGIFVIADQTYWLNDKFPDADLRAVAPYGAIAGSSMRRPDEPNVNWMSVRGLIEGNSGGAIKNLQEEHVAITPSATGASLLRDANGVKQALTSLFGNHPDSQANASSYMSAEIVHRGTP